MKHARKGSDKLVTSVLSPASMLSTGMMISLAVGETVIPPHLPLPLAVFSIGMERGCQQNDILADGYLNRIERAEAVLRTDDTASRRKSRSNGATRPLPAAGIACGSKRRLCCAITYKKLGRRASPRCRGRVGSGRGALADSPGAGGRSRVSRRARGAQRRPSAARSGRCAIAAAV